ncbi:MAG: histidine phosphatase family protein [Lactobacillales bacterium]|jgi:probable phosphoglycerate mutase|nr:histidine phosphatase family protein [Lactobacillales bacterium]
MINFYIFRHGQTDVNKAGRFQGCGINFPLNREGVRQAELTALLLADKKLDVIYTSPLERAVQTANIVSGAKIPVIEKIAFREGNFGFAEGKTKSDLESSIPEIFTKWRDMKEELMHVRFPNGESKREIQERFVKGMEKLFQTKYKNIGISSHGGAILFFLMSYGIQAKLPNGGIIHLVVKDGKVEYKGLLEPSKGMIMSSDDRGR